MRTQSISAIAAPVESELPRASWRGQGVAGAGPADGDAFLGILMLQSRFPRPPGDIGHPASFSVPTRRLVVEGATPPKVVRDAGGLAGSGLLDAFAAAARRLQGEGAVALATSCGFLVLFQAQLQAAVRVPVVTSSLLLLGELLAQRPRVGVLTISAESLSTDYLRAAGVAPGRLRDVLVEGMDPQGEFAGAILGDRPEMDLARAEEEVVAAAVRLSRRAPDLTDLVLECTNMPPYAAAIERATGWRTWSLARSPALAAAFGRAPGAIASEPSTMLSK